MRFDLQEDQAALIDELRKLLAQEEGRGAPLGERAYFSAEADRALELSGFLDVFEYEDLGAVMPALVVQEIAARRVIVEAAASCFLRPVIGMGWPRPLAVIAERPDRPTRFLHEARTAVFLLDAQVRLAHVSPEDSAPLEPFFAYPMARLVDPEGCLARSEPAGDAETVRRLLLVALASELSAVLEGALGAVTAYVRDRRQFGRPLGAFQAVQHRLAMGATNVAAGKWLARQAAALGRPEDAFVAAGFIQHGATGVLYDLHQFMGAMGLTLEHPLYSWSYRAKLLASELGGASVQLREAARVAWN